MSGNSPLGICTPAFYDPAGGSAGLHESVSEELVTWMARLRMLEGVPFRYLVPYDEILPNESVRFFHMDRNWLDALVDGAMSVARMGSREVKFDIERYQDLMRDLHNRERDGREFSNTLLTSLLSVQDGGEKSLRIPEFPSGGTLTGFLFRSSVVRDFPGIEISAHDITKEACSVCGRTPDPNVSHQYCPSCPGQVPWNSNAGNEANPYVGGCRIPTLRQERLSETVMLCIFNGTPSHVRIQEPYEGMRIGVDTEQARPDNGRAYRINLKDMDANFLCVWCDGVIDTAIEPPDCPNSHTSAMYSFFVCNKCYIPFPSQPPVGMNCENCGKDFVRLVSPSGNNDGDKFRGYDVFTRKQSGDNSVLDIAGIYAMAKEQLEGTEGPGVSTIAPYLDTNGDLLQDSAMLAIQMLQFPYQQDFECDNAFPFSVNDTPTDTSGGP